MLMRKNVNNDVSKDSLIDRKVSKFAQNADIRFLDQHEFSRATKEYFNVTKTLDDVMLVLLYEN